MCGNEAEKANNNYNNNNNKHDIEEKISEDFIRPLKNMTFQIGKYIKVKWTR